MNACDLECPFCYAPKTPGQVAFDVVVGWLIELDRHGCLGVGFGGGEPTLYRRFAELCRTVTARTGLAVTFTTHGHRLDQRMCDELSGSVNFIRVSMDGVGSTYEKLRGRSFADLLRALERIRALAPFGINYVVNTETIIDLDAAVEVAVDAGAAEFLLLPEQPARGRAGIAQDTKMALQDWAARYSGPLRLTASAAADSLPACSPVPGEKPLDAYVHVDARGVLKRSSYDSGGVAIGADGVIAAILRLKQLREEGQ